MKRCPGALTATYHDPCQLFALEGQHSKEITILNMPAHVCHLQALSHAACTKAFRRWAFTGFMWLQLLAWFSLALWFCCRVAKTCACACRSLREQHAWGQLATAPAHPALLLVLQICSSVAAGPCLL